MLAYSCNVLRVFVLFVLWIKYLFFFFKQKTAYEMRISDWSSDVCSSDLLRYCPFSLCIIARRGLLALCRILLLVSEDNWTDVQRDFGEIAFLDILCWR